MKIWCLILLVFLELRALSQDIDTSQWILIDCGAIAPFISNTLQTWQTDDSYIKTGTNENVIQTPYQTADALKTLRSFPNQNKNCYTLPTFSGRYFVRAAFLYGNYDRRAKPPTFDLEIDGNKWTTVETSLTSAVYREVIYTSKGNNIMVCLARTKDDETPFISTLEAWPINDLRMYPNMSSDFAWLSSYRYNYGANYMIVGYNYVSDIHEIDNYNRIWIQPEQPVPDVTTISSYDIPLTTTTYEYPPNYAILDAIKADDPTKSITLSFDLNRNNTVSYIEVYFTELETLANDEVRSIEFYVDGQYELTITPQYGTCSSVIAFGPSNNTSVTVELRPAKNSTLPPVVSAIEVYTASDPLITVGTSQDDLDGLAVLISTFVELEGWSGEPCLPSDTVWEWLGCSGTNPPRVTSIKLSSYGLEGVLPDFSTMQDLESIDMSNNRLNGEIPEWLGKLPKLKLLNLKNNDFSGDTPDSLKNNKNIKFSIGNTNHNKSKTATIIALAVTIPLVIILIIAALLYFLIRKNRKSKPGQIGPQVENGNANDETVESTDTNTALIETLTPSNLAHFNDDVALASNVNVVHADESSMVPDMDMDELDEMLNRQGISDSTATNAGPPIVTSTPSNLAGYNGSVALSSETNNLASNVNVGHNNQSSMVPDMDMDELDEMLNRHGSSGPVGRP